MDDVEEDAMDVLIDVHGYKLAEASEALMACDGDVVKALTVLTGKSDSVERTEQKKKPAKKSRRKKGKQKGDDGGDDDEEEAAAGGFDIVRRWSGLLRFTLSL